MNRAHLLFFLSLLAAGPAWATPPLPFGSTVAFEDDFSGIALDTTKWRHRLLGPRRDSVTVEEAVSVADGQLTITTYTEDGVHYSGMIGTQETFLQAYGYWGDRKDERPVCPGRRIAATAKPRARSGFRAQAAAA